MTFLSVCLFLIYLSYYLSFALTAYFLFSLLLSLSLSLSFLKDFVSSIHGSISTTFPTKFIYLLLLFLAQCPFTVVPLVQTVLKLKRKIFLFVKWCSLVCVGVMHGSDPRAHVFERNIKMELATKVQKAWPFYNILTIYFCPKTV